MAKVPLLLAKQIVSDYRAFQRNPATSYCPNLEQVATCEKLLAGQDVTGLPFSDTGEHVARYTPPTGEAPALGPTEVVEMPVLSAPELAERFDPPAPPEAPEVPEAPAPPEVPEVQPALPEAPAPVETEAPAAPGPDATPTPTPGVIA